MFGVRLYGVRSTEHEFKTGRAMAIQFDRVYSERAILWYSLHAIYGTMLQGFKVNGDV